MQGPAGREVAIRPYHAADKRDLTTATQRLKALGVDDDTYLEAQLEAYSWAGKIRPAA